MRIVIIFFVKEIINDIILQNKICIILTNINVLIGSFDIYKEKKYSINLYIIAKIICQNWTNVEFI